MAIKRFGKFGQYVSYADHKAACEEYARKLDKAVEALKIVFEHTYNAKVADACRKALRAIDTPPQADDLLPSSYHDTKEAPCPAPTDGSGTVNGVRVSGEIGGSGLPRHGSGDPSTGSAEPKTAKLCVKDASPGDGAGMPDTDGGEVDWFEFANYKPNYALTRGKKAILYLLDEVVRLKWQINNRLCDITDDLVAQTEAKADMADIERRLDAADIPEVDG